MKTAREIIARTYDREQAAQMGEPDPWQDGTEHPEWECSLGCADVAIAALAAEGFSIVETGRDPATIEACAKVADELALAASENSSRVVEDAMQNAAIETASEDIAAAIRALSRSTREGKTE